MSKITQIDAHKILDSRGNYTIKVMVSAGEVVADFSVPAGASVGTHEAISRDADSAVKAVKNELAPALKGYDPRDQREIDQLLLKLDGTPDKSRLGANAILGVSVACAKLASRLERMPVYQYLKTLAKIKPSRTIPYLFMNLINGGKHASSYIAFQEYMVVPVSETVDEALTIGTTIQKELRKIITESYSPFSLNIGDEGGYVIEGRSVREPLAMLQTTIASLGLKDKVRLAMDTAASSFYQDGFYEVDGKKIMPSELLELYKSLNHEFNIFSIEDPFYEEDFDGFRDLRGELVNGYVVGDDLTVTNPQRLQEAINKKSINAIIIKMNQIGTLSETFDVMKMARDNDIECIVSHRSGETNDDFIADLAYAFGVFGLKAGAPRRGERIAKYNRLWEIAKS